MSLLQVSQMVAAICQRHKPEWKLQPPGFWFLSVSVWHKSETMELENAVENVKPIDADINLFFFESHQKDFS